MTISRVPVDIFAKLTVPIYSFKSTIVYNVASIRVLTPEPDVREVRSNMYPCSHPS
jgi:hypothetical protein